MLGSYTCPHCDTKNACDCTGCQPHINPTDVKVIFTPDGETLICGNCKKLFTYDQALDREYADWVKLSNPEPEEINHNENNNSI